MWWSNGWDGYGPMHWTLFGPVTMVLFLLVCVAVVYFVMRGATMGRNGGGHALEILKERYARGEIDQAEFEKRRRLLEG